MIELLCLAVLLYGAFRGWKNGLVKEVISFVGFFLGFFIAYEYYKRAEVGVLGFLLIAVLIIWGRFAFVSDNYASPLVAVISVGLFLIGIRQKKIQIKDKWQSFFWRADRLCFAVYLIHPIFIQTSYRVLKRTPIDYGVYPLSTIAFFIFFVIVSFAAAFFIVKLPGLKKILL